MIIVQVIRDAVQYLSEAADRIFSPSRDEYPAIGVQPFDGEPYSEWVDLSYKR
jgi:hypothetical protein